VPESKSAGVETLQCWQSRDNRRKPVQRHFFPISPRRSSERGGRSLPSVRGRRGKGRSFLRAKKKHPGWTGV